MLSRSSIDIYKYVVRCDAYSHHDKARILLNHIYFNEVEQEHIEALIETHTYRKIVGHRNYSPRIIEWMTTYSRIATCDATDYPEMFISSLDNPADLWRHAFEHQISDASRHLLIALATCGREVVIEDLRVAFCSYHYKQGGMYGFRQGHRILRMHSKNLKAIFFAFRDIRPTRRYNFIMHLYLILSHTGSLRTWTTQRRS